MRSTHSVLFLLATLTATVPIPASAAPATPTTRPQFVRVSYVEGEVKISTGLNGSPDLGKSWIPAGMDFPIADGATLATEQGRAQVEFENGSMVFLAEHSVLQFNKLSATSEGTDTEVLLLTGRSTFAIESGAHDSFTLSTLVASLHLSLPRTLRVESAIDGSLFYLIEGSFTFEATYPALPFTVGPGESFRCVNGQSSPTRNSPPNSEQIAWDQWVAEERDARQHDLAAALQLSGLAAPIPGLVDLAREGTFSDCPPYGKCWQPNDPQTAANPQSSATSPTLTASSSANSPAPQIAAPAQSSAPSCISNIATGVRCVAQRDDRGSIAYYLGPCGTGPLASKRWWVDKLIKYSPQYPEGEVLSERYGMEELFPESASIPSARWLHYPWATCHAGAWLPSSASACKAGSSFKNGHCQPPSKKWVVGPKRKHSSFLRVQVGTKQGLIPKHPDDVKGHRPINANDGVVILHGDGPAEVAQIKPAPQTLVLLPSLPAGYENAWAKHLPKVPQPVIEGRLLDSTFISANSSVPRVAVKETQSIRYDYKSRSFVALLAPQPGLSSKDRHVVAAYVSPTSETGKSTKNSAGSLSLRPAGANNSGSSSSSSNTASHNNSGSRSSSHSSSSSAGYSHSSSSSGSSNSGSSAPSHSSGGGSSYSGGASSAASSSAAPTPAPSSPRPH